MAAQTMASTTTDDSMGEQMSRWCTEPYIAETNFDDAMMWDGYYYTLEDYEWINMNCGHIPADYGEKMKDFPPVGIKPFQESAGKTAPRLVLNDEDFAIGEIEESVSPESAEVLKPIKDSESTGESELHEKREASEKQESPNSPEELNSLEEPIGEELDSTENSESPKEPRSPDVPSEIAGNQKELLDKEVIKSVRESCELVATTEISSDQSKDGYENHGFTSLSNNGRRLIVRENLIVDVPSNSGKRKRSGSKSDEGVRRSERSKTFIPEYNEKKNWRACRNVSGGRSTK
ncbi:hypothetical protein V496_08402 [Pseudogymnoascus sp. VKM F-4515 (FW-2607)]|nr:hypothetical protein V496_08402 [Pseudogymnoascus sp. VKM F-4515 (FW-2607)]